MRRPASRLEESATTGSTFGWALFWALLTLGVGVLLVSPLAKRPQVTSVLEKIKLPARFLGMFGVAVVAGALLYLLIGTVTLGGEDELRRQLLREAGVLRPGLAVPAEPGGEPGERRHGRLVAGEQRLRFRLRLAVTVRSARRQRLELVRPGAARGSAGGGRHRGAARQPTMPQAQRAVAVFAALFPVAMLFAAMLSSDMPVPLDVAVDDTHVGATFGLAILWGLGAALLGLGVAAATPWGTHLRSARPAGVAPGGYPSGPARPGSALVLATATGRAASPAGYGQPAAPYG